MRSGSACAGGSEAAGLAELAVLAALERRGRLDLGAS